MCGINIIYLKKSSIEKSLLKKMNDKLKHRGPDDEGYFISKDKKLGLAHRRLSIIDLSKKGKQPMQDKTKRYVIVFNGEIYNYKELRKELNTTFKTNTDTEVILELYKRYGKKCLNRLRGMFVFAIYDKKTKELFIARDRIGQKPLVYTETENGFFASSELPALLETKEVKKELNVEALGYYFLRNFFTVPEPLTIFKNVYRLEPAHYIIIKEGKIVEKAQYWQPDFKQANYKNSKEKLKQLLRESVKLREIADVEISVLLSGGIDSSTVVAFLKKGVRSYAFGNSREDEELKRAKIVSKLFSTHHKEILIKPDQIKLLREIIRHYGEPIYNLPLTYAYEISKQVRKDGIKVALTGNGGDEIFYGYDGTTKLLIASILIKILERMPKFFVMLLKRIPKLGLIAEMSLLPMKERKALLYRKQSTALFKHLFSENIYRKIKNKDFGELIIKWAEKCKSKWYIDCSYWIGLMLENAHAVTIAGDIPAMANSVEFRAPFLDHKLIEFAFSLSPFEKVGFFNHKKILKEAMKGILPEEILYAKKMGFGYNVKVAEKIRHEWKEEIERVLNKVISLPIFNPTFIKKIWQEHLKGKNNTKLIMALYAFGVWWEEFME